ncbi:DUF7935 family protein [Pleomorphovibrio marinus]|uniref:DUF7935 family protein n=1 Tax=Pleomorphovibrio marinus TaxID=2164132 RepID=UPI000E0CA3F2|nr:hypothetical protein [Pleomorphovibrio marinus]
MEYLTNLLMVVLPAGLAIYGMYIIAVSFLKKEREFKLVELKTKNTDVILPVRLQAGERLCLFLERITPNNLLRRVNQPEFTSAELHARLIGEVREEFNHNLSQQVYFSDETWESVRNATEQVLTLVNRAYQEVHNESKGLELAKKVFQLSMEQTVDTIADARKQVKSEIRVYF